MGKILKIFFKEGNIKRWYIKYIKICLNCYNGKQNINKSSSAFKLKSEVWKTKKYDNTVIQEGG